MLLKYGANPEQRAEDGSTPLEKALLIAGDGSKEGKMLVEILENAGAVPTVIMWYKSVYSTTLLY